MSNKYLNPPIVEVVCELRASSDSKWDLTIPGLIYEELKGDFPNKEQRIFQEFGFQQQEVSNVQQVLRSDERAMSPDGLLLRLGQGDCQLLARVLSLEPVVLSADVQERSGVQAQGTGQLVRRMPNGLGQRASSQRMLLAP